jgi:hypothetical protein
LGDLNPTGELNLDHLTDSCPHCGLSLSPDLLNTYSALRSGMEEELYGHLPSGEARVKKLGYFFGRGHGWEPYVSFIITAALSGVIRGLAYDLIKDRVPRMFKRKYPGMENMIRAEVLVDIFLRVLQSSGSEKLEEHLTDLLSGRHEIGKSRDRERNALYVEQLLKQLSQSFSQGIGPDILMSNPNLEEAIEPEVETTKTEAPNPAAPADQKAPLPGR